MFPLKTNSFPATSGELARLLNQSLGELFVLKGDPVSLREVSYPHLATLEISLDGAQLRDKPPGPPSVSGETRPALRVDAFRVEGTSMAVGPASIDFRLTASDVQLGQANDRQGQIVLLLQNAAEGRVEISALVADLEGLISEVAKTEAGRHGVSVDGVELDLRSQSPRSLAAEVRLRAKKLFVSASLRITGQLDLDEELNARISGLDCAGDGAIASVACGVLNPHLQKMEGRVFPLMSLPLGDVRLHDVRLAVGNKLSVTAEFGSADA